jgi:hypothetical protein
MNYTYKNAHYEIMNALPNVTAVKLHYPSYAINDAVSQGALGNLRLNIVTTDNMKEIIPVLRRDHLPWEIVMQVTVGRRERTLTVTHIVSHKSEDIIDEFDIRGDEQTRIHFFIHGKGKVTVRDYDLSEVIDDGCVWGVDGDDEYMERIVTTEDVRCLLYNVFQAFLWGVQEGKIPDETPYEKTQNRFVLPADV